jgi:hypothetical protein
MACSHPGMRGNFLQLSKFLRHHLPSLDPSHSSTSEPATSGHPEHFPLIHGENYPPPPFAQFLVSVMGYGQLTAVLLMIAGRPLFRAAGVTPTPAWLEALLSNKVREAPS